MIRLKRPGSKIYLFVAMALGMSGCTSFPDYIHNGFKVGPNYCPPPANLAQHWIDAGDVRLQGEADLSKWWTVFNDPVLDGLIHDAYRQNLSLKEANARVLEARAQLGIAIGGLFPQSQSASGSYQRRASAVDPAFPTFGNRFTDNWTYGFSLAWELDIWGKFRRTVISADENLQASVESYDNTLVTLLGNVATTYITVRQLQEQIILAQKNVELQEGVIKIVQARLDAGRASELDLDQAQTTLFQTMAQIPNFEIQLRQAENQLCILMGMPPVDLAACLAVHSIPTAPPEAAIGIPALLINRRPDVRQAERLAASQAEQIGIATANLYPHISITGTLDYSAQNFSQLFQNTAFNGSVGPSFQWNILNYGVLANNIRYQDQRFQELVLLYRDTVLTANSQAENAIVTFLKAQSTARELAQSVTAAEKAVRIVIAQYRVGTVDFTTVATIEQNLVTVENQQAQARGQIDTGLVQLYTALGGGWQIRLGNTSVPSLPQPPHAPIGEEHIPSQIPNLNAPAEQMPPPPGNPVPQPGNPALQPGNVVPQPVNPVPPLGNPVP